MAVSGGPAGADDTIRKPELNLFQIVNMSFGFFGIQIGFALQNGNVSRIFQTLGADMSTLPLLWLAGHDFLLSGHDFLIQESLHYCCHFGVC